MKTVILDPRDVIVVQLSGCNLPTARVEQLCTSIKSKLQEILPNTPIAILDKDIELTVVKTN